MTDEKIKPLLKITGLHVENHRALKRVDWPADGMGWGDKVPDMVMVGGINGSGKTTLLELIVSTFAMASESRVAVGVGFSRTSRARLDFTLDSSRTTHGLMRAGWGDQEWLGTQFVGVGRCAFVTFDQTGYATITNELGGIFASDHFAKTDLPGVIYLPADRTLEIPVESYKGAGRLDSEDTFIHIFKRPSAWKDSLEALLYNARWLDLNAKEEGHPEMATRFQTYASAFETFFDHRKRLAWHEGKLVVEVADGAVHSLTELSSGEKQVIVLAASLLHRWRPGSLVLIDEPESHLHPTWQTRLWEMLTKWQKERGGQVIVATQSNHLFGIAEPRCGVLLGGDSLR